MSNSTPPLILVLKISIVLLFLIIPQSLFSQPRVKENINSGWQFYKGEIKPGSESAQNWEKINLPHTWNALDMLDDEPGYYRGTAWYRREFTISPQFQDKQIWICFEGANQDAEVFMNGQPVGEHLGGYTAFNFNITPYLQNDKNLLEVKLSNAHNPDVPPVGGDLGHFGGIYRNVYLLGVNDICIDPGFYASPGILVSIPHITDSNAELNIKARLNSSQDITVVIEHEILDPAGRSVVLISSPHNTREGCYFLGEEVIKINEGIQRWSPLTPVLYTLVSRIKAGNSGILLDEVKNQIGFRSIEITEKQDLVLNGSPLFIKGIGKHQDFYKMGYAVPDDILEEDIRLLKETGANLVRSHYPLSPSTYNVCDQSGVLVWAKIPVMDKITHSEAFEENSKNMMLELMYQNYNRPSFILWGYACEIFGDMDWYWPKPQDPEEVKLNLAKTREFSEEFEEFVRKTDPYRLTGNDFHTDLPPSITGKPTSLMLIC
jgi:beta-galactosidase